jgi:hypothetical protein
LSSTSRDIASSASAEYPPWRGGASAATAWVSSNLPLLLDAIAFLDPGRDWLDFRRLALRDFLLLLAHDFRARLLDFAAGLDVACGGEPVANPGQAVEHAVPDAVHRPEPRHTREERYRSKPHREQQQRRAQEAHRGSNTIAQHRAKHAAGRVRVVAWREMQRRESATARERH